MYVLMQIFFQRHRTLHALLWRLVYYIRIDIFAHYTSTLLWTWTNLLYNCTIAMATYDILWYFDDSMSMYRVACSQLGAPQESKLRIFWGVKTTKKAPNRHSYWNLDRFDHGVHINSMICYDSMLVGVTYGFVLLTQIFMHIIDTLFYVW